MCNNNTFIIKRALRSLSLSNLLLKILVDKVFAESLIHSVEGGEQTVNVVDGFNLFVQESGLQEVLELFREMKRD